MVQDQSRRRFIQTTTVAGLTGLVGAGTVSGQEETPTEDGTAAGETRLSWFAGGTGGTYFPLSNEFKTVVEDNTDFTLNVQSTGASVENVGALASGDADFALIQNDVAFFAKNGTGIEVFEGSPVENLRGVATLYPETITIVTLQGTGIEQLSDLEGATVNTGDLGSGTQVNALQILDAAGIQDFTEQNASFAQAADQLRNGDIDAAFIVGGYPVGAIEDLATTNDVQIVSIGDENREEIKASSPWFADDTIPGGTYTGVDEDVQTVAVQAMIATNAEQSDETVEAVTAAIFDNADQLTIKTDFIGADTALDGMSIELHPGAASYFDVDPLAPIGTPTPGGNQTMAEGNATMAEGNETVGGGNQTDADANSSG